MNILHTATLYGWGGEQNKILNEMKFAKELGHNVYLFCNPDSEISKKAKELNFEVIIQKMNKKNYHKSIPKLYKTIKEKDINLVISHGSTDSWVTAITKIFTNKKNTKFMRERHNMYPIKGFISKFMHKNMFDKILYISSSVYQYLRQIGVNESKLFYLPDSVDTKKLYEQKSTFKEEFTIKKGEVVIGIFTSLYKKKGVYDFAKCAKEILKTYPNAKIVFAGKIKDDVKDCVKQIFEKKENLIFTGYRTDAINIIKSFDIYIFPSHCEGLGTVLLEAMCSKTPIIVYDKEPMNILIKNNVRGKCAKYLNYNSLAENALWILENKEKANQQAKNALNYVKEKYDHNNLKDAIKKLLEEI